MPDDVQRRMLLVNGEKLKRNIERTGRGGGNKFHPYTSDEALEWIRPQALSLRNTVDRIPDKHRGHRVLFQATLFPNYLAASYFPHLLLSELDLIPVGSRISTATYKTPTQERHDVPTKSLVLAGVDNSFDSFVALTESMELTRSKKSAVDQIRELSEVKFAAAEDVIGTQNYGTSGELLYLETVLHPGSDSRDGRLSPIDNNTFEKWVAFVNELDGKVVADYRRHVGGLTFVPIRVVDVAVPGLVRFNPLRSVRLLPSMRHPVIPGVLRSTGKSVAAPSNPIATTDTRVAIFDGGTSDSDVLPTCSVVNVTTEPNKPEGLKHGSGVTGAVLYGNIMPGDKLKAPSSNVTHYRIFPHPNVGFDPEVYWVLDQIEKIVRKDKPDIVNLSIGPEISVEETGEPNRWTSTLDELAYEHDVLFVVAAGNNGEADAATGLNRVQVPADMANGLSVGSCTNHHPELSWTRTPYSAIGPGRTGNRVQPSGVQFGGNNDQPFYALSPDGYLMETVGTSFAAPLLTHSLARLGGLLGPNRTTLNNLRAFAIHMAHPHERHNELLLEVGHGRFEHDFVSTLSPEPNECLVLYEDSIARDEIVALPLPVPLGINQGFVQLAWTLTITAPTDPSQPLEYTCATVETVFRPHDQQYILSKGSSRKKVNVSKEQSRVGILYKEGYELASSPAPLAVPGSLGTEGERRDSGKWETIRHYKKRFRATSLRNPQLELRYLARSGGLLSATASPSLDYTLLVSISGPKGFDLYTEVRTQYTALQELKVVVTPGITIQTNS